MAGTSSCNSHRHGRRAQPLVDRVDEVWLWRSHGICGGQFPGHLVAGGLESRSLAGEMQGCAPGASDRRCGIGN